MLVWIHHTQNECPLSRGHTLSNLKFRLIRPWVDQVPTSVINNSNPPTSSHLSVPCLIRILGRISSAMNSCEFAFNLLYVDDILAYVYPHLPLSGNAYLTFQRLQNMIWKINTAVVILLVDHLFNVMSVNFETEN